MWGPQYVGRYWLIKGGGGTEYLSIFNNHVSTLTRFSSVYNHRSKPFLNNYWFWKYFPSQSWVKLTLNERYYYCEIRTWYVAKFASFESNFVVVSKVCSFGNLYSADTFKFISHLLKKSDQTTLGKVLNYEHWSASHYNTGL